MVQRKSFDELADLVSDGRPVDWDAAEREADPAERSWIHNLRVIGDVARMARTDDPASLLPGEFEAAAATRSSRDGGASLRARVPSAAEMESSQAWGSLRLLEKVGSGSFGDVYRAWDAMLNRQVALKLMNTRAQELPDAGARVLEEARLLAKVDHPNVAHIYGVEEHDGRLGIWMEFVEGTDLASVVLERGRFDVVEAAKLGAELCAALAAVHASNVVHKDVKAQNVMLRRDGRLVLMDFGAGRARRLREGENEVVVTGTPRYMAPETFRREPATPQSDLYSVGVLLYHLVTGDFPVTGTIPEIIAAHEQGVRTPLAERDPGLAHAFVAIVERATATRREDRYASAKEMEGALRDFVQTQQTTAERTVHAAPRRSPRRRILAAVLATAAVVTAAIVGNSMLGGPGVLQADVRFVGSDFGQFTTFEKDDEIGPGSQIEMKIRLNRPAYVYVLNRDAVGNTTLLYPMANAGEHRPLAAGEEHVIPGEIGGDRIQWTIDETQGVERFLVVASVTPLPSFEDALQNVAQLDATQLGERPIDQLALNALGEDAFDNGVTRGVSGLARARDASTDPFAVADMIAEQGQAGESGEVFLYQLRLKNVGR